MYKLSTLISIIIQSLYLQDTNQVVVVGDKQMADKGQSQTTFQEENFELQQRVYSLKQYVMKIWDLGLITYGGPMSHIGIFRKRLVQDMNCIKDQKFVQLLTICQSLPGPTSTQLLTAISMYATSSFIGGLVAFILFSLPAFTAMLLAVLYWDKISNQYVIKYVLPGFRVVAVAVILQAFVGLFRKITMQYAMVVVVLVSAAVYYFKPTAIVILIEFAVAAVVGLVFVKQPESNQNSHIPARFSSQIYGLKNMILFALILAITTVTLPYMKNQLLIIFSQFYKIGSLVIGGGHVILPLMYSQFQPYGVISQQQFYNGFSLISIMPGPMFNLCVYVGGAITGDIWGALSAFFGLYLPCFLFVLFILPFWEIYRKQDRIKSIIAGVCSASIGLILAASIILYQQQLAVESGNFIWFFLITVIVALCYGLLSYNIPIIIVFILGDIAYISSVFAVQRSS